LFLAPHCAHQVHESASSCPQCGAVRTAPTGETAAYASYGQVPWYRKRWFAIVSVLVFSPIFLIIAFTGNVYFEKNGQLQTIPKNSKFIVLGIFILMVLLRLKS
jgi:hypothetical protein